MSSSSQQNGKLHASMYTLLHAIPLCCCMHWEKSLPFALECDCIYISWVLLHRPFVYLWQLTFFKKSIVFSCFCSLALLINEIKWSGHLFHNLRVARNHWGNFGPSICSIFAVWSIFRNSWKCWHFRLSPILVLKFRTQNLFYFGILSVFWVLRSLSNFLWGLYKCIALAHAWLIYCSEIFLVWPKTKSEWNVTWAF